jgi:hypothetical protein
MLAFVAVPVVLSVVVELVLVAFVPLGGGATTRSPVVAEVVAVAPSPLPPVDGPPQPARSTQTTTAAIQRLDMDQYLRVGEQMPCGTAASVALC